jgi:hypothetical protein
MKTFLSLLLAAALLGGTAPASVAEPRQVIQGTQVHLTLLNAVGTIVSRDGDPFVAIVSEPVYVGDKLLIPAGTRIHGTVGTIERARRFSVFRGQAYMNLNFRSMEIDSRLIPIQMSILSIERPVSQGEGRKRRDVIVDEGQLIQQRHDYKGDILFGSAGTGGGALAGAIFGNIARGFGIGLAGSAAYIVVRKGKEVELPAQSVMLVRVDNTVTVPMNVANNTPAPAVP